MKAGWPTKTLGEVCQFRGGGTPSKAVERYWRGKIPWVSPKDMKFAVVSDSIDHISKEAIDSSATSLIPKHSVLMVVRSGILARTVPIAITGRDLAINQDLKALCPNDSLDARFLYHLLDSKMDVLLSMVSRGATVHRLITDQIRSLDFILPPLPEQQRIVGILDKAFEGIATAKANAEQNLQNARALFESHLQSVFSQRGEGWTETTLGAATAGVFTGPFGSLLHKRDYVENGVPLVNPAHITETGIEPDLRKTVSKQTVKRLQAYIMRRGYIVIGRRGEMGRCALVTEAEDGWLCGTGSFFIKPSDRCDPRYMVRFLRSEGCKKRLEKLAGGAVMPNLSNTALADFPLELPPLAQQRVIVERIDSLAEETQRLESIYQQKQDALDELKKSLLHQAFTGNL